MPDESYLTWVNIFDKDLNKAYTTERKELKTASMILCALQKEFEKIKTSVHTTYEDLRTELENKDKQVQQKPKLSLTTKGNTPSSSKPDKSKLSSSTSKSPESTNLNNSHSSPDFFDDSTFSTSYNKKSNNTIDLTPPSPNLKMKRKPLDITTQLSPSLCFLSKNSKCDKQTPKNDFNESTLIDSTPASEVRVKKGVKTNLFLSKKKAMSMPKPSQGSSTMHQYFNKKSRNATNCDDATSMDITDILNLVNEDSNEKSCSQQSLPSSQTDVFSVTGVNKMVDMDDEMDDMDCTNIDLSIKENHRNFVANLNDSEFLSCNENYESPVKKVKNAKKEFIPVHAKKEYVHWECDECKRFYGALDLPPETLKRKMGPCTRHKAQKKQPDTMPGFWNMTFETQE